MNPTEVESELKGQSQMPSPTIRVAERDLRFSRIAQAIERLSYAVLQADAMGTIDEVSYEDAPTHIHDLCRQNGDRAVRVLSVLALDQAKRRTGNWMRDDLEDRAKGLSFVQFASMQEQAVATKAVEGFIRSLFSNPLDNPAERVIAHYEHELTEPISSSPASQVARTGMRLLKAEVF
jgi:hypothetical protein